MGPGRWRRLLLLQQRGELLEPVEAVEEVEIEFGLPAAAERHGQDAVLLVVRDVRNLGDGERLRLDLALADHGIGHPVVVHGDDAALGREGTGLADLAVGRIEHVESGDDQKDRRRQGTEHRLGTDADAEGVNEGKTIRAAPRIR